uniref:Myosin-binding protein C, fast-type-like n=1 Tax=Sinocyclocheilus grahami TaxID=75366 RepID=A0A672LIC3_SINGR
VPHSRPPAAAHSSPLFYIVSLNLPVEHVPGEEPQMSQISGLLVEKPQSVTAVKGKNVTFVTKVDSSQMLRKPTMKWLKGKWMDLGSKAGKHLQFKETYDRNTKIYTYEMTIVKVVDGDAGGYRCEVTSKDKCDSCTFDISVEDAGEDAGELDFSGLLKKRERKQKEEPEIDVDVWEILKNAKPCDYEKIAFEYGITDLRGLLKRLKKMKKVEPKKSDAFLKKLDPAYSVEKGKKIQLSVELADPNAQVKWLKNGQEIKPSAKYIFESVGGIRKLIINKCTLADDAAYECVIGEEKSFTEVFVQEPPVTITKMLDDVHVVVGEKVEFEVEVSEEGANVKWKKDGVELSRDGKYRFKKDGTKHWLIINEATAEDIGTYYVYTSGGESKGELEVEEKELEVLQSIADLTLKAAEQAVFKCEVSDEKVTGKWFKDGVEVIPSDRIKMTHIGRYSGPLTATLIDSCISKLTSSLTSPILLYYPLCSFLLNGDLPVGEKMLFRVTAVNIAGRSPPAVMAQAVTIREIVERPKIRLPRQLRTKYIKRVGEKVNLVIPFQGKPRPVVTWLKDGAPLDTGLVNIRTSDVDTILFIRQAAREHSGQYTLSVQIENMEDKVNLEIQIVDKPGPPIAVTVTDVWGFNAALEWKPPKDNGNCEITGYTIQKADLKTKEWFTVLEHNRRPSCTVSDLVMGNEYTFRVFSENICGMSDDAGISKNTAAIAKTGLQQNLKPYKEKDMCSSPKFITPLVDRSVIAGYSAAISCAVRGHPKPKIIWMKNKMIIGEDPKYLMQNNQGVLTLNIRKPSLFDGGKYTCRAINDLGEDEVECKLEVRVLKEKEEVKK